MDEGRLVPTSEIDSGARTDCGNRNGLEDRCLMKIAIPNQKCLRECIPSIKLRKLLIRQKKIRYIDLATIKEIKANDYREGFEKVRDKLRLERQADGSRPGSHCFKSRVGACVAVLR